MKTKTLTGPLQPEEASDLLSPASSQYEDINLASTTMQSSFGPYLLTGAKQHSKHRKDSDVMSSQGGIQRKQTLKIDQVPPQSDFDKVFANLTNEQAIRSELEELKATRENKELSAQ